MNSGTYSYFLNGEPTGVIETFDIKTMPDGSKLTTSIRDAKPFNTTITVKTIEKKDKFQTCKIAYQKDELHVEADYKFTENSFQVLLKSDGKIVQDETFDLPKDAIFFPLMRCFQGNTILQVAQNQDFTTVIVPDIQPTTKFEDLLKPTFDERTAKFLRLNNNLSVFKYLSKHYNENSEFHLDKNGLLIYYKFVQSESQTWKITLESQI
jgi:hypothetical protein